MSFLVKQISLIYWIQQFSKIKERLRDSHSKPCVTISFFQLHTKYHQKNNGMRIPNLFLATKILPRNLVLKEGEFLRKFHKYIDSMQSFEC